MKIVIPFLLWVVCTLVAKSQIDITPSFYSPEGYSLSYGGQHYLIMKDFIPLTEEKRLSFRKQNMPTYLDLPLEVRSASFHGNVFRTQLFCF